MTGESGVETNFKDDDIMHDSRQRRRANAIGAASDIDTSRLPHDNVLSGARQGWYDGYQTWSVHLETTTSPQKQVWVSLHERLHHELQHTSPWGLLSRFALDLSHQGIQPQRFHRLFRFCRESSRTVHEVYANTLAIGEDSASSVDLGQEYAGYLAAGRALAGSLPWEIGRFQIDALLRCCMSPSRLGEPDGRLASLRIAHLDDANTRPDRRLAKIDASVLGSVPSPEEFGLVGSPSPSELDIYFSVVAAALSMTGIPTLDADGVRSYIDSLIADVIDLAPEMRSRIEIDDSREAISDDLQEHARERLYLHSKPLPIELIAEAELASRVEDFVRHHPTLGAHLLVAWLPVSQLATQFVGMPELDETTRTVPCLALLATGKDALGDACVRCSLVAELDPGPFARAMTTPTVILTSASALMGSPGESDFDGIDQLFVLLDGPVLQRILDRYAGQVGLMWTVFEVTGDRNLYVIAIRLTVLTNYVWLALTGEAGRSYYKAWLEALDEDQAQRSNSAFTVFRAKLDAVVRHLVETWWYLGQESEALFDDFGE